MLAQTSRGAIYRREEAGQTTVLKVLREGALPQHTLGLDNELDITADLDVAGVRRALRRERGQDGPSLLLEWAPGQPLAPFKVRSRDDVRSFLLRAVELTRIVADLHDRRLMHLDLRPENVLWDPATGVLTLTEFEHAARTNLRSPTTERTPDRDSSLAYVAPEQTGRMNRNIDTRTDLYGLGATFYALLAGRPPFDTEHPVELIHAHLARRPDPPSRINPHIPGVLDRIILQLLEKEPASRYASARGLLHDLRLCLGALERGDRELAVSLGTHDVSGELTLPRSLFGRESLVHALKELYDQAGVSRAPLVLLTGGPGIGKSALADELRRVAGRDGSVFASGKCDLLHRAHPYYCVSQALGAAVSQLLVEPDAPLAVWRASLGAALSDLGVLLTEMIPGLDRLLGPHHAAHPLAGQEAEARLQHLLLSFIGALGRPGQPLVLFLDDLQWGDDGSLKLIRWLAAETTLAHVLVIGAFRDGDLEATHPLRSLVPTLGSDRVRQFPLANLKVADIEAFLEATLRATPERVASLAQIVLEKTGGNPLFVRRFLQTLAERDLLTFEPASLRWQWSEDAIRRANVTDNVVELMVESLLALPAETRALLESAATLGARFDLEALSAIEGTPPRTLVERLTPAWSRGLIEPQDDGFHRLRIMQRGDSETVTGVACAFTHDRLHQAAYSLIPAGNEAAAHARAGRQLTHGLSAGRRPAFLFEIVAQLSRGRSLLDRPECHGLARLCLEAGARAEQDAAYEQAAEHYIEGLAALGSDPWSEDRQLALDLHLSAARTAALSARFDQVERYARPVIDRAEHPLEVLLAYDSLLMTANAQDRLVDVIRLGRTALRPVGISFPGTPGLRHVIAGLLRTKFALRGKSPEKLVDLPEMGDPVMAAAMHIMERMVPAAFRTGSKLFPLLVFEMVRRSLRHGNMRVSCFAYAAYAITLSGVLGDVEAGLQFGDLSLALVERLKAESHRPQVLFVYENFLRPQTEPLRMSLPGLQHAFVIGPRVGNVFDAMWAGVYHSVWRFAAGDPLPAIAAEIAAHRGALGKEVGALSLANLLAEVVATLRRPGSTGAFTGDHFDESAAHERYRNIAERTEAAVYHVLKLQLAVLFGRPADGEPHAREAEGLSEALTGLPYLPTLHFYSALARLQVLETPSRVPRQVRASLQLLRKWAAHSPAAHAHRVALIEGEIARIRGEAILCLDRHSEAVEHARRSQCLPEEALACELAANSFERAGRTMQADLFRRAASSAFRDWGASSKAPAFPESASAMPSQPGDAECDDYSLSRLIPSNVGMMDAVALTKAAAAMTSEIVLDRLLARLVDIVAENAGAGRGALVLNRAEGPWVEASSKPHAGLTHEFVAIPLAEASGLSVRAVQFVLRTQQLMVVDDALIDPRLASDPHVTANRIRSIICAPIRHQGRVVGAFYLENDSLPGAFDRDRAVILELLAAPAAIALENARLYDLLSKTLEAETRLNEAHRRFVPHEFLETFKRDNIADVRLGDSVVKEMTVLFSDVRGFTGLAETMSPSNTIRFLNSFLSRMEPSVFEHGGFIDSYVGDSLIALFESPDQAVRAALSMLESLAGLNVERAQIAEIPIQVGIGINTGLLTMATLGGHSRMKCTVIGDSVNVASRIERLTRTYNVPLLVSDQTRNALLAPGNIRQVDRVRVRGRHQHVGLHEIFDHEPIERRQDRQRLAPVFEAARLAWQAGNRDAALLGFAQCAAQKGGDPVANYYLERGRRSTNPMESSDPSFLAPAEHTAPEHPQEAPSN